MIHSLTLSSFLFYLRVSLVLAAPDGGLALDAELAVLAEVDLAKGHEELRPRGVQSSLRVGGYRMRDDITSISLKD